MRLVEDLKSGFSGNKELLNLILINLSIFIVLSLTKLFIFLAGASGISLSQFITDYLSVTPDLSIFFRKPWTLITYMFTHVDFFHILFNLLILFWTGKIFSIFLPSSKIPAVYILGGIAGGLLFILLYNTLPAFSQIKNISYLIGASAGVLAVLTAAAILAPDYPVHLLLFGEVKLKFIALTLGLLYLISIPDGNSGGHIAHMGGIIAGFIYIKLLKAGTDIGKWIELILHFASKLFSRKKIRIVHRSHEKKERLQHNNFKNTQQVIDAILDKINRSGYESLTKKEKEILFKASKDNK